MTALQISQRYEKSGGIPSQKKSVLGKEKVISIEKI